MNFLFRTIPAIAKQLSISSYSACWLVIKLWYFALTRKLGVFSNEFPVSMVYNDRSFTLYLQHVMDLAVLKEVFVDMEYEWDLPFEPKVIVDLGAHYGDTALYYSAVYPDAKIIAVEPSPENFARLEKHVADYENIIPVNAAVGAEDGVLTLHLSRSSLGHSIVKRESEGDSVQVELRSLDSLMQQYSLTQIDLLKFDIEGAEFDLFGSIKNTNQIKALIGELHFDLQAKSATTESVTDDLVDFTLDMQTIPGQRGRYIVKALRRQS